MRASTRSITPRATAKISRNSSAPSRRWTDSSAGSKTENRQSKIRSLPLDRAGRFARDVEADAVDAFDFVADACRDPNQQFVGKPHPIGGHAVLAFDDAQNNRVFVSVLIAHHAARAHRQQDGERLPDP